MKFGIATLIKALSGLLNTNRISNLWHVSCSAGMVLLLSIVFSGCCVSYVDRNIQEKTAFEYPIHPLVFNLTMCYESDLGYPVATAINLTAIARNRNQYDSREVRDDGEWVVYDDQLHGRMLKYKVISRQGVYYKILYIETENGASLSVGRYITFYIEKTNIVVDGVSVPIENLVIIGMDSA
jgi:hypothetical protein